MVEKSGVEIYKYYALIYYLLKNAPKKMLWGKTSKPTVASNQINVAWNDLAWRHSYEIHGIDEYPVDVAYTDVGVKSCVLRRTVCLNVAI